MNLRDKISSTIYAVDFDALDPLPRPSAFVQVSDDMIAYSTSGIVWLNTNSELFGSLKEMFLFLSNTSTHDLKRGDLYLIFMQSLGEHSDWIIGEESRETFDNFIIFEKQRRKRIERR